MIYSDEGTVDRQLSEWGFEHRFIRANSMAACIAWNDSTTVIAFRGTDANELADWIIDITSWPIALEEGKMHRGFYCAYQCLEREIYDALPVGDGRQRELWIAGHSLGGALAVICGYRLAEKGHFLHGLVTFGQPMLVNNRMATFLGTFMTGRYMRFVNESDVVPKIPPWFMHFGKLAWFREGAVDIRGRMGEVTQSEPLVSSQQFPPGERPLSNAEFQRLKQVLRVNRKGVDEKRGVLMRGDAAQMGEFLKMFEDHGVDHYVEKLRVEMLRAKQANNGGDEL